MAKNVVNDVTPPKRSIRQVILPREREEVRNSPSEPEPTKPRESKGGSMRSAPPRRGGTRLSSSRPRKSWRWLLVVLGIILVFFIVSSFVGGARLVVTTRAETTALDGTFTAKTEAGPLELAYQTLTVRREASEAVAATGEKQVETKASGVVTIYNNYSEETQRFIKNTRFESPEGLIFRVQKSVDIPGKKADGTPGSISVEVIADSPGTEYNIDPTTFTVPGLEGSPLYDGFSARSSEAMAGGFSGTVKTVDPDTESSVRARLASSLKEKVAAEAQGEVPTGFVLFDSAASVTTEPETTGADGDQALVKEAATLTAPIFNLAALGAAVARNTIADFDDRSTVRITNIDELTFNLEDPGSINLAEKPDITFTLSGNPHLVWQFDEAALRADLAGKSKPMVNTVLSAYPSIERAEVVLRPFWKKSFPENPDEITISVIEEAATSPTGE